MRINKSIRILLIGSNLWNFGEGMLGPLFAVFAERIGGDLLDISWAWALYLIFAGVVHIAVGKYGNGKLDKKKLLVYGCAVNTLLTFGYLLVSTPWHLFVLQILLGIAAAFSTPAWDALYAEHENKKQDLFQWALAGGAVKVTTGIAIIFGGLIVYFSSFTYLFITMGVFQLFSTISFAKIMFTRR